MNSFLALTRPRVRGPGRQAPPLHLGPLPGRGRARLSAALLCLSFIFSIAAFSEVVCVWNGNSYECSGSGDAVLISGGGPLAPVVTNGVGVCTNCSAIPPDRLDALANQLDGQAITLGMLADDIMSATVDMQNVIESNNNEIATYLTFGQATTDQQAATNYMFTVQNSQTAGMLAAYNQNPETLQTIKNRIAAASAAGIYYYANNTVLPQNGVMYDKLENAYGSAEAVKSVTNSLLDISRQLQEGAQVCQGSGGNSSTNSAPSTGDWCTYEQGEAIKDLLTELQTHLQRQKSVIDAISNYNAQTVALIRSGFYSDYNAIPSESRLGDTWQNVYLQGSTTSWGYAPSNILARIELLLYGMSGVGTNVLAGVPSPDEAYSTFDDVVDSLPVELNVTTDLDTRPYQSLGDSIVSFFRAFEVNPTPLYVDTELIPEVNLSIQNRDGSSSPSVVVPALRVGNGSISVFNTVQNISHACFTVVYAFVFGITVFLFWRGYSLLAVKFFRWIIQIVQSFLT